MDLKKNETHFSCLKKKTPLQQASPQNFDNCSALFFYSLKENCPLFKTGQEGRNYV